MERGEEGDSCPGEDARLHEDVLGQKDYGVVGNVLAQALKKPPRFTAVINVLLHAFGGFKDSLSPDEKRYFLGSVEEYRDERIPLSALLRLIEAWAVGKGAGLVKLTLCSASIVFGTVSCGFTPYHAP
jgi:hypothetical protein